MRVVASQANYQSYRTPEQRRERNEFERFRITQSRKQPRVAFNNNRAVFHNAACVFLIIAKHFINHP